MSVAGKTTNLANAEKTFRAVFFQQLEKEAADFNAIVNTAAMRIASTGTSEEFNFADQIPAMTEWIDERRIKRLSVQKYVIANKRFESTITIDRDDLMDDKLNILTPRIQNLASTAARHQMDLLRGLINNGFVTTGAGGASYDTKAFFADDHPSDFGTDQDNKETAALAAAAYQAAVDSLEQMKDEAGEFLNNRVTHLICGVDNRWTALDILQSERLSSGATNVNRGTAQLLLVPGLTAGYWAVADLSKPVKPFVLLEREGVRFDAVDRTDQTEVFLRNKLLYGATYRGNMGYGLWQLMVGSNGTT